MPTVLRWRGYRFFFFSNEGSEPAHIHVEKDDCEAKFWLEPISVARNDGFSDRDLRILQEKVAEEADEFRSKWNDHFSTGG